jgi:HAD superfamily hydrolase (TIGR01549 family)
MVRFEACLLDYGNTLVEFDRRQFDFILRGLRQAFHSLVGPIEEEALREVMDRVCTLPFRGDPPEFRELSPRAQMEILLREGWGENVKLTPALVEECDRVLQDLFVDSISVEPEVERLLGELKSRLKVGLVSNHPCGRAIRRSLEKVGIVRFLDPVVISGEVGYVKPHAAPFARALEALDLPPEKVLFVGDRWEADMLGAWNAGMRTCHHVGFTMDPCLKERYQTYQPDFRITSLEELKGILLP